MPSPSAARLAALCAALVLVSACGDDDSGGTAATPTATATATATQAAATALDEDALLAVHDELYECLRKADVGVLVSYRDGEAAVGESFRNPVFDSSLAAPDETAKAIEAGAQYVGLRDNRRSKGLTPDWDVLIFASEDAAVDATPPLRTEAGDPAAATQNGRFVTVVLPDADANGDDPDGAEAKLETCQETAEGG